MVSVQGKPWGSGTAVLDWNRDCREVSSSSQAWRHQLIEPVGQAEDRYEERSVHGDTADGNETTQECSLGRTKGIMG